MSAATAFFGKEVRELLRTWRLPVVAGIVLFFALSGPVLALLTPQLLESMQGSAPGVVIKVPDPTWRDAYAQWIKNLTQIVSFVAIIAAAGSVAGEVSSGTALLVLTKPVSRGAFVAAKALALTALLSVAVLVGTAITQLVTLLVFGAAPTAALWASTLAWLLFAALLVSVGVLLSSVAPTLAAAGLGVGVFFALSLAALWGPAARFTPAGLAGAPARLLAGDATAVVWPVVTTVVACVVLVGLAAVLFGRREL